MKFKRDNLNIKYSSKQNAFFLIINYEHFSEQLKDLHKSNVIFSTYKQGATVDGFIPLSDSLYVRLSIIHKLGSIVKIDEDISNKQLVKMKVDAPKKEIVIAIIQEAFKNLSVQFYECKFNIKFPVLNDLYIDLSIASGKEIISDKWNLNSTPNQNALNKDFKEADQNRYNWSQNTDGNRKKNELFTGSGSNLGVGFKIIKKAQKKKTRTRTNFQ